MSEDDYKGLASILSINPPKTKPKVLTPEPHEDPLMDFVDPVVYMKPLELPKNVLKKDEYGYTPAQNREINNYLTRRKPPKLANVPILYQEIKAKVREENAVERIDRIKYEFGESKKRPSHLDNKNIVSWESKQRGSPKVARKNESKLNQPRRKL